MTHQRGRPKAPASQNRTSSTRITREHGEWGGGGGGGGGGGIEAHVGLVESTADKESGCALDVSVGGGQPFGSQLEVADRRVTDPLVL
eukprot:SAG11_NODE_932_length_6489_cov_6.539039_4_plen_88_part_00